VLAVEIDEVRLVHRRKRRGYIVLDRRLNAVVATVGLHHGRDLWSLLPGALPCPFTTRDLAAQLRRPLAFAQRVAYCLRTAGAVAIVGKQGNRQVYATSETETDSIHGAKTFP
jgi:hypothetical protein